MILETILDDSGGSQTGYLVCIFFLELNCIQYLLEAFAGGKKHADISDIAGVHIFGLLCPFAGNTLLIYRIVWATHIYVGS